MSHLKTNTREQEQHWRDKAARAQRDGNQVKADEYIANADKLGPEHAGTYGEVGNVTYSAIKLQELEARIAQLEGERVER